MSQDIFRKYPNKYETIISTLCENLDSLDEPEARAAMIWIVGEYAERIDNADEILQSFLDGFHDENTQVRRQFFPVSCHLGPKGPNGKIVLIRFVHVHKKYKTRVGDRQRKSGYCGILAQKVSVRPYVRAH